MSGNGFHHVGGGADLRTMVSMLAPQRFRDMLTYKGHKLGVGMTTWKVLQNLGQGPEYAFELGGQSFALGYEIHLAATE
eukprot:4302936-Pyramimonas_sp.AAC.1